jgi:hypothetical protein
MFVSAFSLACFAMLRVGEFAADKKCDVGLDLHVVIENYCFNIQIQ